MGEGQTLREVVQTHKGRLAYQDLADRAGGSPGLSRWQQYGTGQLKSTPDRDSILGIATALNISVHQVWDACGWSLGLPLSDPEIQAEFPPSLVERLTGMGTERLPLAVEDAIVAFVGEYLDLLDQAATEAKPTNVRAIKRAARKTTGHEHRGPRGGGQS